MAMDGWMEIICQIIGDLSLASALVSCHSRRLVSVPYAYGKQTGRKKGPDPKERGVLAVGSDANGMECGNRRARTPLPAPCWGPDLK